MDGFSLDRVPPITQAPGALEGLGAHAARLGAGRPALLVADPGLARFGIIARAEASLRRAGLTVITCTDIKSCLLYTSPSPRDGLLSRMPSSA